MTKKRTVHQRRAPNKAPNRAVKRSKGYPDMLRGMVSLLDQARHTAARAVNVVMTATYYEIGRRIVEHEQSGASRASYGEELIARLAEDLTERYGRGFSHRNLDLMKAFYLGWNISQTLSAKSWVVPADGISQTVSAKSRMPGKANDSKGSLEALSRAFPLPWSHYVRLLTVSDESARRFYEAEALRGGWSVRQLDRQIATRFYERVLLSRNKRSMLRKAGGKEDEHGRNSEEAIRDPFILEFTGLKGEFTENKLEDALVHGLEHFLLELGNEFTFIGRQRKLRVGKQWYRVDLLFFHRKLRCLVVVDLKVGRFTHADAGQMNLYLNYAREHWTNEGENPPVGIVLCSESDDAVAHYAMNGLDNKMMAREYKLALPEVKKLEAALEKARKQIERQSR